MLGSLGRVRVSQIHAAPKTKTVVERQRIEHVDQLDEMALPYLFVKAKELFGFEGRSKLLSTSGFDSPVMPGTKKVAIQACEVEQHVPLQVNGGFSRITS